MSFWDKYQLYFYVAALALMSWWLVQMYQERVEEIRVAQDSPDFFSKAYYKREMDLDGRPRNELNAEEMLHQKVDGAFHLQKPTMTLYNSKSAPWVIQSDSAIMAANGDDLQLNGAAVIHRDASQNGSALTVNTSDLKVKLSTNYAETQAWAEIISPPNKTSGTGMQVTFVSPIHLKLLSKVKGRYEIK